jgi:hypothetical protein
MMRLLAPILFTGLICIQSISQVTWDAASNVIPPGSGNDHPRIVLDGEGDPIVLWSQSGNAMVSKWNDNSFDPPVILNPISIPVAGASWMGPDVSSRGDTLYVVFKETPEHEGHIWCMTSFDGGTSFSDPIRVDFTGDSLTRFPTVTIDSEGHPIVAFMKFNSQFSDARWVVSRSEDFGNSFLPDVLASGWSSPTADVCDCCPGSIISSGENVVMLYRDNNNNIRDTWAGFSSDGGRTFTYGLNIDRHNWMISACPSSGPDAVVAGDTLYSVFMNGASGKSLVYTNKQLLKDDTAAVASSVTPSNNNIGLQNFPRIAGHEQALGMVWKQIMNGQEQLVFSFTSNLSWGWPATPGIIATGDIENADIVISEGNVYVVWEDNASGTMKFRHGTFDSTTSVEYTEIEKYFTAYPNPASGSWLIRTELDLGMNGTMKLYDPVGQLRWTSALSELNQGIEVDCADCVAGIYFLEVIIDLKPFVIRLVKN